LRAILVGLLAFVLATQAAAAATLLAPEPASHLKPAVQYTAVTLDGRLEQKLAALRKYRGTILFFHKHRTLVNSNEERASARAALARAGRRIRELSDTIIALRAQLRMREARRLEAMSPRAAICDVFGSVCRQAVAVSWCESRLDPGAHNGEYLGLFQMGSNARRLFGHGDSAHQQAEAAHRYFVSSGSDWSPWSCGWAAAL
jgi:hypothetical protein